MEVKDFTHDEISNVSNQTKYMANEFYRSLTNAMREYVVENGVNTEGNTRSEQLSHNVWTMMRCFWLSFKYSSYINANDKLEMDGHYDEDIKARLRTYEGKDKKGENYYHGLLSKPFANYQEAFFAMDKLFEKAGKARIFIDYHMQMSDYDPEDIKRQ